MSRATTPASAKASRRRLDWSPATAVADLPMHLRVPLGGVLALGDLEVRPLRVERRKVKVYSEGEAAREQPHECWY